MSECGDPRGRHRYARLKATAAFLAMLVAMLLPAEAPAKSPDPPAPRLVDDINPSGTAAPAQFVGLGKTLYFAASDGVHGRELWRSDGTESGTRMVKDINPSGSSSPYLPLDLNGTLLFFADDGVHGRGLWRSDGTEAGTQLVEAFPSQASYGLVAVGDQAYFVADDGVHGRELWRSDGTESGTRMVKDMNPSGNSSFWQVAYDLDGILLFFANDGVHGGELWRSDGTAAGTQMVKDVNPSASSVVALSLGFRSLGDLAAGGALLFYAEDGVHGRELWRSDGTESGTRMVKDINPAGDAAPSTFLYSGGAPGYFYASDGVHGTELWVSDGTEANTKMLIDVTPGSGSGGPSTLVDVGGTTYFPAHFVRGSCIIEEWLCALSFELYSTDGTEAGTALVGSFESYSTELLFADLESQDLFAPVPLPEAESVFGSGLQVPASGLWSIDPVLRQADRIASGLYVYVLFSLGSTAVISGGEPDTGQELWISDGTAAGTELLSDISPGPDGSVPQQFIRVGSTLFFTADDGVHGRELWALDADKPPAAFDDEATVAQGSGTIMIDVLANDTDIDGGLKEVVSVTVPSHGTAAIVGGGSGVSYRPSPGYCGLDSFDYELNGGSTATVSVMVSCVDQPPTGDGSTITVEGVDERKGFASCVAKAREAFRRRRNAAMHATGKARSRAVKRAARRKHRAISKCGAGLD